MVDMDVDAPFDEMPGEVQTTQGNIDEIPEVDVTEEDIQNSGENAENWLIYGNDYENRRLFSGDSVTPETVSNLEVEYQFELLEPHNDFQGSPIIVQGDPPIMYVTFGPDHVFALNARTGEELWHTVYEPAAGSDPNSPPAERGVAVLGDMVYKSTLDLGVLALNRYTGEEVWYYNGACVYRGEPIDNGELMPDELVWAREVGSTSSWPPIIYDGILLKGSFGGEFGVSGFFDAIDVETGTPIWRVNMTVPDKWVGESWQFGGATAWPAGALDRENETVIIPSANPGPWYGTVRPGWNPYSAGKVAVDVHTGEYRWHYQDAPHDWWDYDSPNPAIVFDAEVDGEERRLVCWAGKTGWVYTIDAESGRLVQRSDEYVQHLNMFDLPPKNDLENAPWIMTDLLGGTNPQTNAYDPESNTLILKGTNTPIKFSWHEVAYEPGERYIGMDTIRHEEDDGTVPEWNGSSGVIAGLDPVSGEVKWQDWFGETTSGCGGCVTTTTGVTFAGSTEGQFFAYETETGERLWEDDLGVGVAGDPVVWEDPGAGTVSVAITAGGRRGPSGNIVTVYSMDIDN